jgi:hypothetical protein
MSRWYEAANEASFKAVKGGYVFQNPNPWIFARPSYYRVNEQQKAKILIHLGHWRLMLLLLQAVTLAAALVPIISPRSLGSLLVPAFLALGPGLFSLLIAGGALLIIAVLIAIPQIYLARSLHPMLAKLPHTHERIKVCEQLPKIAAAVSGRVLVIGLIGAVALIGAAGLKLVEAYLDGHLAASVATSSLWTITGVLLGSYFGYIMHLKAKVKRTA